MEGLAHSGKQAATRVLSCASPGTVNIMQATQLQEALNLLQRLLPEAVKV